ncbi:MAG: c-type heme family protein [Candidatus Bathyanammoxibius sp.]
MAKASILTVLMTAASILWLTPGAAAFDKWENLSKEEAKVIVQLLDDVYKFWIVFDTRAHVENMGRIPSATIAKEVFVEMDKKGWHSARLITTSKNFFNPENRPKDDFEMKAVEALNGGSAFYEAVEVVDGKKVYRAATPVPLVIKECKMCHVTAKDDELLGALVYTLPLSQQ